MGGFVHATLVMVFLGDYVTVFPATVAVINGALAVFSGHYPFKTQAVKLWFIVIVALLSVGAISATFYSQYLVVLKRNQEREDLLRTREALAGFIAKGNKILDSCPSDVNDLVHTRYCVIGKMKQRRFYPNGWDTPMLFDSATRSE
jgi:hypothetical protein